MDPDIRAIRFVSLNGTPIAGAGRDQAENKPGAILRIDILSEGDRVGILELTFPRQRIAQETAKVAANTPTLLAQIKEKAQASVQRLGCDPDCAGHHPGDVVHSSSATSCFAGWWMVRCKALPRS
ncbi:MAG: hypothetical protein FD153_51 [Rhodospirillaceae bacterium]|nr:MAG: hypothetical protein FD153_51 [Rhodospirillaceae bacterium]